MFQHGLRPSGRVRAPSRAERPLQPRESPARQPEPARRTRGRQPACGERPKPSGGSAGGRLAEARQPGPGPPRRRQRAFLANWRSPQASQSQSPDRARRRREGRRRLEGGAPGEGIVAVGSPSPPLPRLPAAHAARQGPSREPLLRRAAPAGEPGKAGSSRSSRRSCSSRRRWFASEGVSEQGQEQRESCSSADCQGHSPPAQEAGGKRASPAAPAARAPSPARSSASACPGKRRSPSPRASAAVSSAAPSRGAPEAPAPGGSGASSPPSSDAASRGK